MSEVTISKSDRFGHDFIPGQFLPDGKDEYYLRNLQSDKPDGYWRSLNSEEIELLVKNDNSCDDWDSLLVHDPWNPRLVKNSTFHGLVRIGAIENVIIEHHDLRLTAGITNSVIIASDIGDNCAVHNVRYIAHYIVGNNCVLFNIDEMHTTNHAKFGNGILKDGEAEDVRVWLELMNEAGGREVLPFDGMIPADAYIWLRYREDAALQKRFVQITQSQFDSRRGYYGTVDDRTVIKHSRIIKDVKIGSACYIKGANKLKNLTINSSDEEPTQIGEGVELVNGIVGYQCRIFYGCKAVRFIMGRNSSLKYGARLIHSFLGDNSTVSCCEILHNLIFPAHEQHHNNSFLTASCVLGQSNIAAGATVGSNHNSRANDGEIFAGRGFWPGLCVTVKHSCRFASFTLISKGDYPAEMDIPLPFSLLSNNQAKDELVILPAFWWMFNMYALARNSWKFKDRDKRRVKTQKIEFDAFAPDTAEEMFRAMRLLELYTGRSAVRADGKDAGSLSEDALVEKGRSLLAGSPGVFANLIVSADGVESSKRKVIIAKPFEAYRAYDEMLFYYAMKNIIEFMTGNKDANFASVLPLVTSQRVTAWTNIGGQLMTENECNRLLEDIKTGKLDDWNDIHEAYARLYETYITAKQRHAFATLGSLLGTEKPTPGVWSECLDRVIKIQEYVRDQVYDSRKKDYDNPIRSRTYRNALEKQAVVGTIESNSFIKQVRKETEEFKVKVLEIKKRG